MKLNKYKQLIAAAALLGVSVSSHAALISAGTVDLNGTGLGSVNTVLTLQNNNRTGTASGYVEYRNSGDFFDGDVHPTQNQTFSFDFLNVTRLQDLLLVFNPSEPGNAGANGLTLESLTLSIFSDTGAFKYSTSLASAITYSQSETGTGGASFAFRVDPLQGLPAILGSDRIGLSASLSNATAGLDSFFVLGLEDEGEGPGSEIPEPGSIALLGLGIAGMTALRRRRRKA